MHQHFRDIRTVRLILDLREDYLHGADNLAGRILGDHENAFAPFDRGSHAAPESVCRGSRDRQHETNRGAAFNAVDEHVAQFSNLAITCGIQGANANGVWHCFKFLVARENRASSQNTL
jgi:hypothetical protein